jgi:hypothetical protein
MRFALLALLLATNAFAQSIATTDHGILVAHDQRIELVDENEKIVWSADGVAHPSTIVTSAAHAAVLDPLTNEAAIVDLESGRLTIVHTGESPIGCVFVRDDLYLLERDARAIERIGAGGSQTSIKTPADPAFIRTADERIYIYSRLSGDLNEITTQPFAIRHLVKLPAFASDLEVDGRNAYLVYPRAAKIVTVSLATLQSKSVAIGAVPVDLAIGSAIAVADPSAQRVWVFEGEQSFSRSFGRGFLRGLFGMGSTPHNSDFPTGIDRVVAHGKTWIAYDSATGSLYDGSKLIASKIDPHQFAVSGRGVFIWNDAVRRLQKIAD